MDQATVIISFDLPSDVVDEFRQLAHEEGIDESELFCKMLRVYCAYRKHGKQE